MLSRHSAISVVLLGVIASIASTVASAMLGCNDDTTLSPLVLDGGGAGAEAADADTTPKITVTTLAPSITTAPAAKASATWAAYRLDDGEWLPLMAASEGTYNFPRPSAKWAIALVCAASDDSLSTVFVHRRTIASTSIDVSLEYFCTPPPPPPEFTIDGNLLNVPTTTEWLEFGYALDSRGVAIPASGNTIAYEEVGIAPGTWDLAFGIRNDSFGALTKIVMHRGEVVVGDKKVDVDINGPGSFVPGTKPIMLRGMISGDSVTPQIFYGTGGPYGIALGPDDVPANRTDAALAYATVPDAFQLPTDRYRGTLAAEQDRRTGTRTITFDIHQAIPLDLTFLPEPAAPVVTVLSAAAPIRLETKVKPLANAVSYEVRATAQINRRTAHAWQATFDAASVAGLTEIVDTMPDLSKLPGWKMDWALTAGIDVSVFATGIEGPTPLGDGTMQRRSSKAVSLLP